MDVGKVMPDGDPAEMSRFLRARAAGHSPGYDIVIYARPHVWIALADEIERLRDAMDDALEMLADTSLNSEDRAGNAQMCLALALRPAPAPSAGEEK